VSIKRFCNRKARSRSISTVSEMLKSFTQTSTPASDFELEWDETYKAERLISLLYSGAQLRQEIDARLQELAEEI
jgi:hypothetical protein